jgi:hypothetical protein
MSSNQDVIRLNLSVSSPALSQRFDGKLRFEVFKHVDLQLAQRFRGSEHPALLRNSIEFHVDGQVDLSSFLSTVRDAPP